MKRSSVFLRVYQCHFSLETGRRSFAEANDTLVCWNAAYDRVFVTTIVLWVTVGDILSLKKYIFDKIKQKWLDRNLSKPLLFNLVMYDGCLLVKYQKIQSNWWAAQPRYSYSSAVIKSCCPLVEWMWLRNKMNDHRICKHKITSSFFHTN